MKVCDSADNRRTKYPWRKLRIILVYPFPLVLQETRRCFLCSNDKISYERIYGESGNFAIFSLSLYVFPRLVKLATALPTDQWILFAPRDIHTMLVLLVA